MIIHRYPHPQLDVFHDELRTVGSMVHPVAAPELITAGVSVWYRPLAGNCAAVALLNGAATPLNGTVAFEWLTGAGWGNATAVEARDLWGHAQLGRFNGSFTPRAAIPSHASVALRLCALF